MSLNEDLMKVVANSLPAMQVEALKKELDRAGLYDYHAGQIEDLKKDIGLKANRILELEAFKKHSEALDLREATLLKREQELEIQLLKKDVSCLKETNAQIKDLMHAAFKNTIQRKFINGNGANNTYSSSTETTEHE
jgi:hypothetical protein